MGLSWQWVAPKALCCGVGASLRCGHPTPGYPEPGALHSCMYGSRSIQHQERCAGGYLQTKHPCAGSILHLGTQHLEYCAMGHMQSGHSCIISILGLGARCWEHPAMGALSSGLSGSRASLRQQHPASGYPSPPVLGSSCNGVPKIRACLHYEHPAAGYQPWAHPTQGSLRTQLCCAVCTLGPVPFSPRLTGGKQGVCRAEGLLGERVFILYREFYAEMLFVFYKLLVLRVGLRGCLHTQGYAVRGSPAAISIKDMKGARCVPRPPGGRRWGFLGAF